MNDDFSFQHKIDPNKLRPIGFTIRGGGSTILTSEHVKPYLFMFDGLSGSVTYVRNQLAEVRHHGGAMALIVRAVKNENVRLDENNVVNQHIECLYDGDEVIRDALACAVDAFLECVKRRLAAQISANGSDLRQAEI